MPRGWSCEWRKEGLCDHRCLKWGWVASWQVPGGILELIDAISPHYSGAILYIICICISVDVDVDYFEFFPSFFGIGRTCHLSSSSPLSESLDDRTTRCVADTVDLACIT